MSQTIPYMGTKKELSASVLQATSICAPGRIADLFAGMGSVAAAHKGVRQVWANDVQHFAFLNNKCRLVAQAPNLLIKIDKRATAGYEKNKASLLGQAPQVKRFGEDLKAAPDFRTFKKAFDGTQAIGGRFADAYCCFANRYGGTYLSLEQCIETDSVRCMLEQLRGFGLISFQDFDWGVLCLGAALLRCANTTGHFAQYMKPNEGNWRRVQRQFRKSVWDHWLASLKEMTPFGEANWRKLNIATRLDATGALDLHQDYGVGVVYCDPPYTNDQYSRFYHLWETLVLYDYPSTSGDGLYRGERFVTEFSSKRKVSDAFSALISKVASIGADFVLSYPSNGLLYEAGGDPEEIMGQFFKAVSLHAQIPHRHSSMGGSKGVQKNAVAERIYVGRHAR